MNCLPVFNKVYNYFVPNSVSSESDNRIDALPNELFGEILSHLDSPSLRKFSLLSKGCYKKIRAYILPQLLHQARSLLAQEDEKQALSLIERYIKIHHVADAYQLTTSLNRISSTDYSKIVSALLEEDLVLKTNRKFFMSTPYACKEALIEHYKNKSFSIETALSILGTLPDFQEHIFSFYRDVGLIEEAIASLKDQQDSVDKIYNINCVLYQAPHATIPGIDKTLNAVKDDLLSHEKPRPLDLGIIGCCEAMLGKIEDAEQTLTLMENTAQFWPNLDSTYRRQVEQSIIQFLVNKDDIIQAEKFFNKSKLPKNQRLELVLILAKHQFAKGDFLGSKARTISNDIGSHWECWAKEEAQKRALANDSAGVKELLDHIKIDQNVCKKIAENFGKAGNFHEVLRVIRLLPDKVSQALVLLQASKSLSQRKQDVSILIQEACDLLCDSSLQRRSYLIFATLSVPVEPFLSCLKLLIQLREDKILGKLIVLAKQSPQFSSDPMVQATLAFMEIQLGTVQNGIATLKTLGSPYGTHQWKCFTDLREEILQYLVQKRNDRFALEMVADYGHMSWEIAIIAAEQAKRGDFNEARANLDQIKDFDWKSNTEFQILLAQFDKTFNCNLS